MTIVIEDGTGVTGANSYVSVAEFNAYATARNVDPTDYDTEQIEGALVVASVDFISVEYNFKGEPLTTTQGMQLPTDEVLIVSAVKNATCAAALLHLKSRLFVDTTELSVNGAVTSESKSVGSLSKSVSYDADASYRNKYPTANIDKTLLNYLQAGGYAPSQALRY